MIEQHPRWGAVFASRPRRGGKTTEQRLAIDPGQSATDEVAEVAEADVEQPPIRTS
jgi:hypothetical protein